MPYITKIPLGKIQVVPNLQNAMVGALLQIRTGNDSCPAAEAVLRCALGGANGVINGVVYLEGGLAGTFVADDEELNFKPAIDISDLAHVVLDDPAPRNNSATNRIKAGDICQASHPSTGNTFLCMAVCLPSQPSLIGFALLDGKSVGEITFVSNQFYIGRAAVVPLDESSTN